MADSQYFSSQKDDSGKKKLNDLKYFRRKWFLEKVVELHDFENHLFKKMEIADRSVHSYNSFLQD